MDAFLRVKGRDKGRSSRHGDLAIAMRSMRMGDGEEERRRQAEALKEAQRISHEIDQDILESKKAFDKRKKAIKILILGQSESGKSSVLKNFQLSFSPDHFQNERAVWRTIIQLNLIGSIKIILEVLEEEWECGDSLPNTHSNSSGLTDYHRRIRLGLSPLLSIETTLTRMLSADNRDSREVCVRPGGGWKALLNTITPAVEPSQNGVSTKRRSTRPRSASGRHGNDPTHVLAACRGDIVALWEDSVVKDVLRKRNIRLETTPGFFLNDTARIATTDYQPSDGDIVRARIRTMGVEEHQFVMESGVDAGTQYYIYDVGGNRSMRSHWIPYFDDVQAILFLAPLAFNQTLEEDPKINRLEDSLCLWREICSSPLLAQSHLIVFFNKIDILRATLAAGVSVKKYVPSYGDAPNDVAHVTKYFKEKFRAYHKKLSPRPRPFMCYETSAIDTRATAALLRGVREAILRAHLQKSIVI